MRHTGHLTVSWIMTLVLSVSTAMACHDRARQAHEQQSRPELAAEPAPIDALPLPSMELDPIDPDVFFDQLVRRYRGLTGYRDTTRHVQVTSADGLQATSIETTMQCSIEDDELQVRTAGSQVARAVGLETLLAHSPAARALRQRYQLWLAPHMALRFAGEPLEALRGGQRGLRPALAESVQVQDRELVHVQLVEQPDASGADRESASVDIFVDPQSMLIHRVQTQETLPDGTHCATTMDIMPEFVEGATVAGTPQVVPPAAPTAGPPAESPAVPPATTTNPDVEKPSVPARDDAPAKPSTEVDRAQGQLAAGMGL
jgi:hypothetical protein